MAAAFGLDPTAYTRDDCARLNFAARAELAKRAAAEKDVLTWLFALMPHIYGLPFCDLHRYLVSIRHEPEAATEAPRYHAKTAVGCAGVSLFGALEEPQLFDYFFNVQANERKALALNKGLKLEFEQNDLLRHLYGNVVGSDTWTDSLFVLKTGVVFQGGTMGQGLRGTNYRLRRPNYVMLDDAYDDDDLSNLESTKKKNDWVESTLEPFLAQDRPRIFHWTGTAFNDADGLARGEAKSKQAGSRMKFKRFCGFGRFDTSDGGKWVDDGQTVLWPELRSYADWKKLQNEPGRNQVIFNREVLCIRGSDTEAKVAKEWLDGWEYDPNTDLRFGVDHVLLSIIFCCDPSIGKKEENDPTGFAVLLKTQRMDGSLPVYWIDALRNERLGLQARLDQFKSWIEMYRARFPTAQGFEARVETIAGFKDFGDLVAAHVDVPCTTIDKVPDKLTNLEKKSFLFQNQRVRLNKNLDDVLKTEMKYQLTTNYPTHDDLRDAVLVGLDIHDAGLWR